MANALIGAADLPRSGRLSDRRNDRGRLAWDGRSMEAMVTFAQDRSAAEALPGQVSHNIRTITDLHEREQQKLGEPQRMFERLGSHMARPYYLLTILFLVVAWIGGNELLQWTGRTAFDG